MKGLARRPLSWIFAVLVFLAGVETLAAQVQSTGSLLPPPTGSFAVGRVTYYWSDASRPAFLGTGTASVRELMVDVWYPAAPELRGANAPYMPEIARAREALGDSVLSRLLAPAYAAIEGGQLRAHAIEDALATCPLGGCPLLLFSHGGGVDRAFYTSQYEDLASHGYIVAAIAHAFDTPLIIFPDGRFVRAAAPPPDTVAPDSTLPRWRRDLAREIRSQEHVRRVIEVRAADLRFVVDQVLRYAEDADFQAPFRHQVDPQRVGALGHSAGGQTAALACQTDTRIKACLNQDGVMHNLPFRRDANGGTMLQPFMYLGRPYAPPPLSDAQLAALEMSRAEADSLFRAIPAGQDSLLADLAAGAFRVTLCDQAITHMSFSDEPIIESRNSPARTSAALRALHQVRQYTRAFFDKELLGKHDTVLDSVRGTENENVHVERFVPPPNEALHLTVACGARR